MGLNFIKESRMFYYEIQQKCIRVYVINVNHVLNHACTSIHCCFPCPKLHF